MLFSRLSSYFRYRFCAIHLKRILSMTDSISVLFVARENTLQHANLSCRKEVMGCEVRPDSSLTRSGSRIANAS